MTKVSRSDEGTGQVDTDTDRYPNLTNALRAMVAEADRIDGPVERLELNFFANGDCTYRAWPPRAEESQGGYIPGPESK